MKRLFYILAVVMLVVMASGCTSSDQWASNKTYSGDGVTFQYPGTWSENKTNMSIPGASSVAAVGSDSEAFVYGTVDISVLSSSDIQELMNTVSQGYKSQGMTTEKKLTVDGANATMLSSPNKDSSGIYKTAAFWTKSGKFYVAAYTSTQNGTENFEKVLATFKTT